MSLRPFVIIISDWYGSWYADINNTHYDFVDGAEVIKFLSDNYSTLNGTNIEINRSLAFNEAYAKANKTQASGYYTQQDLDYNMCQTVAIGQNQTVRDIRDGNTYMIGKLKDGNCWMLDNLRLGSDSTMTLTPSDTNLPDSVSS